MEEKTLEWLCSAAKLERDKGVLELQRNILNLEQEDLNVLEEKITGLLTEDDASWETKHGALMGCKVILQSKRASGQFVINGQSLSLNFLEDDEFRVRLAAGEVMGALCEVSGSKIYTDSKNIILKGISSNLAREPSAADEEDNARHDEMGESSCGQIKTRALCRWNSAEKIFHDTAGWKSLETWMKCLELVIKACGHLFNPYIDQELLDLVFKALKHTNRFVRETGFYVCSVLVSCGVNTQGDTPVVLVEDNAVFIYGDQLALQLGDGLSDNWSQVRLAASVATRNFLLSLPSPEARNQFFPVLVPRMCLNRYYAAEGVRIYSQETWRLITDGKGKQQVEKYIDQVVQYYIEQTCADNHSVREASCTCIAELGSKIDKSVIRPHVCNLLDALVACFQDDSWPVRDAACLACGNFIECFPEESKEKLDILFPLFFNNLQDNIPSVRQGAAIALCNVMKVYGIESTEVGITKIKEGLMGLEFQSANAEKYSNLDKGSSTYGVAKRLRDNDMELHTDKQMYSCGSLAPKMGRGGGCMDHKFRKPPEPWELADGCVNLIAELSSLPEMASFITSLLPLVAKAASFHHYTQHLYFLETICKKLPVIAGGIGKRNFKSHLEEFLDCIFYALISESSLTSSAASQCLNRLSSFLGPNILRGRVENYNSKYLEMLDANQYIAPL